jgi:restriction system protein
MSRRRRDDGNLEDFVQGVAALIILGVASFLYLHKDKIKFYGLVFLGIVLIVAAIIVTIVIIVSRKKREEIKKFGSDEDIIYRLKGMPPSKFEEEMADMFSLLGYKTEVSGGPHDGGIDVVAIKNGEKYYIQCKKFITSEVGVHDVRDFYGAITAGQAKRGFLITTNKFTLDAERFAEGNTRIELIDGVRLIGYFKMAHKEEKQFVEEVANNTIESIQEKCPLCGGNLVVRKNRKDGKSFLGCSKYPTCKYTKNI